MMDSHPRRRIKLLPTDEAIKLLSGQSGQRDYPNCCNDPRCPGKERELPLNHGFTLKLLNFNGDTALICPSSNCPSRSDSDKSDKCEHRRKRSRPCKECDRDLCEQHRYMKCTKCHHNV